MAGLRRHEGVYERMTRFFRSVTCQRFDGKWSVVEHPWLFPGTMVLSC